MMPSRYDAAYVQAFYDAYGEREWQRFDEASSPANKVNWHIHRSYLERFIQSGNHVLDIGAGPGRFTIELARLGARITVGDISPGQLALHKEKVQAAGYEDHVVAREMMDVVDLSHLPREHFDAVVCYGGPLSYVFDQADVALAQLLQVTKPGGNVLLSVMSLLGTTKRFLPDVIGLARKHGPDLLQQVFDTGDQHGSPLSGGHHCHMYRWSELERLLQRHPCAIVTVSASNYLSVANEAVLDEVIQDSALWARFLAWEEDVCQEPGALDGGTHIVAVLRKNN